MAWPSVMRTPLIEVGGDPLRRLYVARLPLRTLLLVLCVELNFPLSCMTAPCSPPESW